MTDARAKDMIAHARLSYEKGSAWDEWYKHMIQAMEDRAALADVLADVAEEWASSEPDMPSHRDTEARFDSTLDTVRRHMKGEA